MWYNEDLGIEDTLRISIFINGDLIIEEKIGGEIIHSWNRVGVLAGNNSYVAFDNVIVKSADYEGPTVTHPEDMYYEEGTEGHFINWSIYDEYPGVYNITQNDVLVKTGDWKNDENVTINLDNLPIGRHKFVIRAYDRYGNLGGDNIYVTVYEPTPTETTDKTEFQPIILISVITIVLIQKTFKSIKNRKKRGK